MNNVYHFTGTIRLPWILESGEVRPSPNRIGGYPADFLWATTDENGDRTSAAAGKAIRKLWREGHLLLIRFILDPRRFRKLGASCTSVRLDTGRNRRLFGRRHAGRGLGTP